MKKKINPKDIERYCSLDYFLTDKIFLENGKVRTKINHETKSELNFVRFPLKPISKIIL
ncbi:MAG: hypothetical protein U0V03_08310 [Bacteroidia bacterium]